MGRGKKRDSRAPFGGQFRPAVKWTTTQGTHVGPKPPEAKASFEKMPPRDFITWLCVQHTPAERGVFVGGLVQTLRDAVGRKVSMRLLSLDFRTLELAARIGRIPDENLDRLISAADAGTLVVEAIVNLDDGAIGAGCRVGPELVGVLGARDVIVLEL